MTTHWAIDLGTSNTTICEDRSSRPHIVNLPDLAKLEPLTQTPVLPSCVCVLDRDGEDVLIGQEAVTYNWDGQATGFARGFKRYLGTESGRAMARVGGRIFTAQDVASLFLREVISKLEAQFGEDITDVTIATPSGFYETYRAELQAIIRGVKHRGWWERMWARLRGKSTRIVFRTLDEPVAAALGYGRGPPARTRRTRSRRSTPLKCCPGSAKSSGARARETPRARRSRVRSRGSRRGPRCPAPPPRPTSTLTRCRGPHRNPYDLSNKRSRPTMNTTPRNPVPAHPSVAVAMALAAFMAAWPASATGLPAQATPLPEPGQKVALVTGSTSGLGRELALRLGARGDHVIVHGRSEERGAEVVDAINANGLGSARFYRADFASLSEVRQLAETLLADYDRLDILINNAGFGSAPDERLLTEDGHEYRFQVNYLSTFLLTHMLMPRLLASAPSRIVNVSSGAQTPIDFDDVMIEKNFSGRRAYAQSKLAQVMFTLDLAEELDGSGIVVGSLHPATYMPTEMVRRAGATPRSTIAEGADAAMQLVDSDDFESGQYFSGLSPTNGNAQAYDPEARAKLRQLSQELTGIRCRMGRCRFVGGSSE